MQTAKKERIVLFDAECVLCSANAKLILTHDRHEIFLLASMQGEVGARLFAENGLDPKDPSTILVIEENLVRRDSDAVLSIYENLSFPWNLMRVFRLVPAALRDPIYHFIARNRYRIFGRRDTCWLPPEHYRSRVL
jgi:predicted DCC family thiol-disulfide oxidoreductase YuxK